MFRFSLRTLIVVMLLGGPMIWGAANAVAAVRVRWNSGYSFFPIEYLPPETYEVLIGGTVVGAALAIIGCWHRP